MPLTERQINAAVAWWQGVVRRPKFDNLGATRETVSSRERELADMASLMASLNAARNAPDEMAVKAFGDSLGSLLRENPDVYGLSSDYGPEGQLRVACEESGVSPSCIPWKTGMSFLRGGVQVRCGYRADEIELSL